MTKKKRGHPDVEEILSRPWCYYCERDFDDLKILINHQKAKHFKCERCGRRLNTAGGLSVHMTQVHKETLTTIENALPNRSNLDVEIFGMEGIPDDVVGSHNQRVLSQFAQAEAERRAATGNSGPGGAGSGAAKKPKLETPSDLKKRLAEHKAKKAAEQATGGNSGDVTPVQGGTQGSPGPAFAQMAGFAASPTYTQPQISYAGTPNSSTYSAYPQPFGQSSMPFQQQPPTFPQQSSGFGPPPNQYAGQPAFNSTTHFPPTGNQGFGSAQFPNGTPQQHFQGGSPRTFGAGSSSVPYQQQGQYQPPRIQTPPTGVSQPQRSSNLPSVSGLPQRPSFGAPPVNAFQMQQMHQGQLPGPSNPASITNMHEPGKSQPSLHSIDTLQGSLLPAMHAANGFTNVAVSDQSQPSRETEDRSSAIAASVDHLVSGAAADANKVMAPNAPPTTSQTETTAKTADTAGGKKAKKEKEKERAMKMVYTDNEISPEEKMAKLPRYAFIPNGRG